MADYYINDNESSTDIIEYFTDNELKVLDKTSNYVILSDNNKYIFEKEYIGLLSQFNMDTTDRIVQNDDDILIFGKDVETKIVSIDIEDSHIYCRKVDGSIYKKPMVYWGLTPIPTKNSKPLKGNLHYKHITTFDNKKDFSLWMGKARKMNKDVYCIWNGIESAMVYHGITLFKDMKIEELSVLSFDIEANGLVRDSTSKVLVITNTFRNPHGVVTKKQFIESEYPDQRSLISDWCKWVVSIDPMVITGHNINGYDLPYINHCYGKGSIPIGLDGFPVNFNNRPSEKRVDGSQTWTYNKIKCKGRHIVDGMFLAVMYDIGRKYPSWGLKAIAEFEGFVAEDRVFYDASMIGKNWNIPEERKKIIEYCEDDSDDSLNVFDLMAPSTFYMARSIPRSYQAITESASGGWINGMLVRGYLQEGHSIPKANERSKVSGGISFGVPGNYQNVFKIDLKAMYPSIIREYGLHSKSKDPNKFYLKMTHYFAKKRNKEKSLYKETGDDYYNDLQSSSKIFANSLYGVQGTSGLNFNDFSVADTITGYGRQIIKTTIEWATSNSIEYWFSDYDSEKDDKYKDKLDNRITSSHDFCIVNCDTDSISFRKQDNYTFTNEEQLELINDINSVFPELIEYEHDGFFDKVLILKAKNYVLVEEGSDKMKKKGSSITDNKRELSLREMLDSMIYDIMYRHSGNLIDIYHKYIKESINITDINRWSSKKSITKSVLTGDGLAQVKIRNAMEGVHIREGDKVYLYNVIEGKKQAVLKGVPQFLKTGEPRLIVNNMLKRVEHFDGCYDIGHYLERVYKTVLILKNVVDMDLFKKYHLKSNRKHLEEL